MSYTPPPIPEKFLKPYDPIETEPRIQALEQATPDTSIYNPDVLVKHGLISAEAEPFSIIMPPPNANGRLHVGHALTIALEDIFTRYARLRGKRALYVPGADHAGFETQIVYEKKLEKEDRSRFDLTPEELYKEIYSFTLENKKHMEDDVRRLGTSCDWSREKFTLDPEVVVTVQETFRKMFADGLVYRGKRIVNWCAKHQTSLSDVETEFKEQKDAFYYFQYGPFVIGTSRPETKFGDKYVVMHPEDSRYAEYKHGDTIDLEWINGPITATIIKDESVDMEFGTGVMTITPWHDATDFDIAKRHNLDMEQVIDFKGKLLPIAGEFTGMHISKARPLIVQKLQDKGLVTKIDENYTHNVNCCYKCNTQIEPQVKDQWFVKMAPLAKRALEVVSNGGQNDDDGKEKINFIPDNYEKIYSYWMNNTIDWNISRQIVWGIKIPAKVCHACNLGFLDTDPQATCPNCQGELMEETDTFDTWFSSGQWPLLALGYSHDNAKMIADAAMRANAAGIADTGTDIRTDIDTYHPSTIMESGRDLIFKWIPRMVIFSLYLKNEVPFKEVYLHGMVNDSKGQKMSKSKGNVVSPIDMVEKYGADALRMGLIAGNTPGSDTPLLEPKIKGYKNFANKVWNITRFVLSAIAENPITSELVFDVNFFAGKNISNIGLSGGISDSSSMQGPTEQDVAVLAEWKTALGRVTTHLDEHKIHLAVEELYHYIWHTFADHVLEASKPILKPNYLATAPADILTDSEKAEHPQAEEIINASLSDEKDQEERRQAAISRAQTLLHILRESLIALHPFMPHITQEIWSLLPKAMTSDLRDTISNAHGEINSESEEIAAYRGMIAIERWPLQS